MPPRKRPGITPRQNGDGSLVYEIRWRQGGGRDGRRLSHTYPNQKLAAEALSRIITLGWRCDCPKHSPDGRVAKPTGSAPGTVTFGEYAARHAAALTGIGEGYRRDVIRDVERHLQGLADRPIDAISKLDVAEWIRGMETGSHPWLTRPLSPTTIRRQLAQAGAIMGAAINDGLAARNPFRGHRLARRPTDEHSGMTFLTHAEWERLERELPPGVYRDLGSFLVGSGLRWGEATALAVGAVDLLATPARVHVGRAWQSDGKGSWTLGAPKSARSRRTVPIAAWVRDLLIPHVAGKTDDEFLFTTPKGAVIRPQNFYHRVWAPAVKRAQAAGLEKAPRIHDLRHTYVSWSIAEGRPLSEVSRRVGHQSYAITDARYSHLLPDADAASAAALERYRTRPQDS